MRGHPPLQRQARGTCERAAAPLAPRGAGRRVTLPSLRGRSSDIPARTPTLHAPARRWPRLETDPERARHLHLVASRSGACRRPRSPLTPLRPERRDRRGAAVPGPPPACERPPRLGVRGTPCPHRPPAPAPPACAPAPRGPRPVAACAGPRAPCAQSGAQGAAARVRFGFLQVLLFLGCSFSCADRGSFSFHN